MSYQNEAYIMGATVITLGVLGVSVFPTRVVSPPFGVGAQIKLLTAAGSTVQILPHYMGPSNAINIAGATAVGASIAGYPLNAVGVDNAIYTGPANFWLAATGATATVAVMFRYSAGAPFSGATFVP